MVFASEGAGFLLKGAADAMRRAARSWEWTRFFGSVWLARRGLVETSWSGAFPPRVLGDTPRSERQTVVRLRFSPRGARLAREGGYWRTGNRPFFDIGRAFSAETIINAPTRSAVACVFIARTMRIRAWIFLARLRSNTKAPNFRWQLMLLPTGVIQSGVERLAWCSCEKTAAAGSVARFSAPVFV